MAKTKQGVGKSTVSGVESLSARVAGLPKDAVTRGRTTPKWIREGRALADRARQDLPILKKAPLEEPITEADVAACEAGLAELSSLAQARRAAKAPPSDGDDASLAALRNELKGARKTLLAGFEARAVGKPELRRWVTHIRRGDNDADLETDLADIQAEAKKAHHASWIAAAPNGEADALKTIERKAEAFATLSSAAKAVDGQSDRRNRVSTVVTSLLERLRAAGRYSFPVGDARRKGYAVRTTQSTRRKKKTG